MYCEHCGTQIPDGSIFCVACGKKQTGVAAKEEPRQDVPLVPEADSAASQVEQQEVGSNADFDWSSVNAELDEPTIRVNAETAHHMLQQEAEDVPHTSEPKQETESAWKVSEPEPAAESAWKVSEPEPAAESAWKASEPEQDAQSAWQQSGWQGTAQQSAPGWQQASQQSGWQGTTQQSAPGWQQAGQQSGWQGTTQQSAPGWQQAGQQSGWQAQQSAPGWQQAGQQSGWQAQQSAPGWQQAGQQSGWQAQQGASGWQQAPQQNPYAASQQEHRQPVYRNGRIDYGCSMNWYKFQVYFCMIPTALYYLAMGVILLVLSGMYGSIGTMGYGYYSQFSSLLTEPEGMLVLYLPAFIPNAPVIGIGCALYGVLMLVAWVKMIRLQSGGSTLYLILSSLPTVFVGINLMIAFVQLGNYVPSHYLMEFMTMPLTALAVGVLVIILQIIYFRKRSYLFINH